MRHPRGVTITVTPGSADSEFDDFNDRITPTGVPFDVPGCAVAPRYATAMDDRGRYGVVIGLTVYAPADTLITRHDQLAISDEKYVVDGDIAVWTNPFTGARPGIEIPVTRAEG